MAHSYGLFHLITPANEHINCHAGLDPAARITLDTGFRGVTNGGDLSYIIAGVIIQILHLFSKRDFFETVHATQAERNEQ
jgi:hypothetical protein